MPYIHCPQCRLTIYGGTAYKKNKRCPRCNAEMSSIARPLFRSLGGGRRKPPLPEHGDALGGGEQLNAR